MEIKSGQSKQQEAIRNDHMRPNKILENEKKNQCQNKSSLVD